MRENCPHSSLYREYIGGEQTGDYVCPLCGYGREWTKAHRQALAARDPGALGYRAIVGDVRLEVLPVGEHEWEYSLFNLKRHAQTLPANDASISGCMKMAIQIGKDKYPDQDWSAPLWKQIDP